MNRRSCLTVFAALLLAACSTPGVEHYQAERPAFDPARYFAGHTQAWGMFQKRSGEVVKRFTVDIHGYADGKDFKLDEAFIYSDGSKEERHWTLRKAEDGTWRGSAGDVVGEAVGRQAGNALNWRYVLRLKVDGSSYDMDMDDWMYLIDERTLVNRTAMSKLGVEVGQVTLFFRRD